jgi:hypothetical protein
MGGTSGRSGRRRGRTAARRAADHQRRRRTGWAASSGRGETPIRSRRTRPVRPPHLAVIPAAAPQGVQQQTEQRAHDRSENHAVEGDEQGGDERVHPVDQAEEPADQRSGKGPARRSVQGGPAIVHTADDLLDEADVLADDGHPLHGKPLVREVVDSAFGFLVRLVRGNRPTRLLGHRPVLPDCVHDGPQQVPDSQTKQLYACTRQVKEQRSPSPCEHETKTPDITGKLGGEAHRKGRCHLSEGSGKGGFRWLAAGRTTCTAAARPGEQPSAGQRRAAVHGHGERASPTPFQPQPIVPSTN